MRIFYLAGGFNFTYNDFNADPSVILGDYRAKVLKEFGQDPNIILGKTNGHLDFVQINKNNRYIGPFYFYNDRYDDFGNKLTEQRLVPMVESEKVKQCTDAIFFIDRPDIPGTVTEMINAALHRKKIHIFYKSDYDQSIAGELDSRAWYPIMFCTNQNKDNTTVTRVDSVEQFINNVINLIKQ